MFDFTDLLRPLLLVARFLWWLGFGFTVQIIGWSIGWVIWRALTLGRFPTEGPGDAEEAPFGTSMLVDATGLAVLAGFIWWLSKYVPT